MVTVITSLSALHDPCTVDVNVMLIMPVAVSASEGV